MHAHYARRSIPYQPSQHQHSAAQLHQHSADQVHKSDVTDSPGAEIYRERRSVPPCCSTPSVEQRVVCESSATSVCPCLQCVDRGSEATFLCSHDQWRHQVFITGPGHRKGLGSAEAAPCYTSYIVHAGYIVFIYRRACP